MRNLALIVATFLVLASSAMAEDKKEAIGIPGGLDKSVIYERIKEKIPEIRNCYDAEVKKSKVPFSGSLGVKFSIGSDGKVTSASAEKNALNNVGTETCVLGVVKGIEFPAPADGGNVEVLYPFAFNAEIGAKGKKGK